jgi:hypothetical protein
MAQAIECLLCKHGALSSNPTKKMKTKAIPPAKKPNKTQTDQRKKSNKKILEYTNSKSFKISKTEEI